MRCITDIDIGHVCIILMLSIFLFCLQCFDAVGWAAGRASGL